MASDHYIDQLEQANDRELQKQGTQADSMRLVVTFSSGVAATVVAPALQLTQGSASAWWSTSLLFASILAAVCLIVFDRMVEPDTDGVIVQSAHADWSPPQVREKLRLATLTAVIENRKVLRTLRGFLYAQTLAAVVAAGLGAIAMLKLTE